MAKSKTLPKLRPLPIRFARLHAKLLLAAAIGVAVTLLIPGVMRMPTRALIGWDVGVAIYLALTYLMMWHTNVDSIRRRASEQDEGAFAVLLLSIAATMTSLIAIVFTLGGLKQDPNGAADHVLLAFATILLSWAFVHTIFTFHYAHEYYGERRDGKIGGLKFPGDAEPDYRDFLYFSLVIGMTSQVSDVTVSSKVIRRMVAIHGVLSFFFNLVVLALTVNMVANLI